MGACASPVLAQSNQALRDSLAHATDILAYHPDSIDLRLKKAAWNIQLEQWNYAKDDPDKVLYLNNTNIAGLFYRAFVNEKLNRFNFARLDYRNLPVLVPIVIFKRSWVWLCSIRKTCILRKLMMASII